MRLCHDCDQGEDLGAPVCRTGENLQLPTSQPCTQLSSTIRRQSLNPHSTHCPPGSGRILTIAPEDSCVPHKPRGPEGAVMGSRPQVERAEWGGRVPPAFSPWNAGSLVPRPPHLFQE